MKVSIVVPSKGCKYLGYLLTGLSNQSVKPNEVVLVIKECGLRHVEGLCSRNNLSCAIVVQKSGYFTHALNMGKREARGDLIIFTDDDAIPLGKWIERYIKLHFIHPNIAGISSRDIYLNLGNMRVMPTPDDKVVTKLYRWVIRPWLERPHLLLSKYRMGVYLTRDLNIAHGPFIPGKECFSLPFRGVNMSFKASYTYDAWFPEHELLKRASGNEQYFGLQIILKGLDTVYVPSNPVLHIAREESLSRTRNDKEFKLEMEAMKSLYKQLLAKFT
jgi:glycosyltransferase involved in cell wall biosynthesis